MNKTRKFFASLLKGVIALLALGNLVLLFVFDYRIPGFSLPDRFTSSTPAPSSEQPSTSVETESSGSSALKIVVPSEALSYDGTDELDLAKGVSVQDASGAERKDIKLFSTIKAGNARNEKVIEYSATDENGNRITAERKLTLGSNYAGPSIHVEEDLPNLSEEELPNLVSKLIEDNLISADDGFGQDITSAVTSTVKSEEDESGDCAVTLQVVNMLNDSYSADVTIHTRTSGPVLKLTTDAVTLNVGDTFSFYEYIAAAQDENGNDLYGNIRMDGSVDTSTPGDYVLEFYCVDDQGNVSPKKKLTVTVQ